MATKLFIALTLTGALLVPTSSAGAQADQRLPTAAVSLGDSYIAGEAGRWSGNSPTSWGDRDGTDRAAKPLRFFGYRYDLASVYGDTFQAGCNRSDVAPLLSAELDVEATFNLACAGATTTNVIAASSGGQPHNGEIPQVDQLRTLTENYDVDVVALSIGGNDLGFSDIIIDCVLRYTTSTQRSPNTCASDQSDNANERMRPMMRGIAQALLDIHQVFEDIGDDDYRIVLQGYPVPIPNGDDFRYPEAGFARTFTGGCPFWNSDADWANDQLLPAIRANLAAVAEAFGAEFLDLSDALAGREACAQGVSHGAGPNAEWIRFVTTGITQGQAGESVHPNFYGQLAIGRCLALHVDASPGDSVCTNTPGAGPEAMELTR